MNGRSSLVGGMVEYEALDGDGDGDGDGGGGRGLA